MKKKFDWDIGVPGVSERVKWFFKFRWIIVKSLFLTKSQISWCKNVKFGMHTYWTQGKLLMKFLNIFQGKSESFMERSL